ncbi:MAG: valine--tRNA ligase, partial [Janthinobacterium lividum]
VEPREVQGSFTHIRYPLADGVTLASGADHIVVATTRPETMLGDTAVAVNPADERYQSVIGQHIILPLTGRRIPIVADEHADPELGSGAVKITPAHDFNDWLVFERHREIGWINILDAEANIVAADGIPAKYVGMTREAARKAVVADLEALDLIELIEAKTIQMPYGDRSGVVIEPWLTDQWYVDAATLAKPAIEAVRSGATKFVPANWDKTYFNWMDNIQPWCVSRQITWGHQIPAWYDAGGKVHVAATEAEAQALAGPGAVLTRDNDVLDTWFSSALWPFGTLGWPEQTPELARYYPGDVLVTGFDIIFFWVARMMMQGIHFMGEVPFATVYCHGLVRDAKGAKMSKSKGNTVDPLALIDRYGADALRFTLTAMESQGRDIKLDEKRVEGYRNFATKLWNAARFCQSNGISGSTSAAPPPATAPVNRWIIGEVVATARALDGAMAAFRFDGYAEAAYQFVWSRFCDWYLELTKPLLAEGADPAVAAETRAVTGWALDQILVMLHPVMPFLTEELWHKLGKRDHDLIVAAWPVTDARLIHAKASSDIEWVIGLVSEIRTMRNDLNVPVAAKIELRAESPSSETMLRLDENMPLIARMARVGSWFFPSSPRGQYAQIVAGGETYTFPLDRIIDISVERARLEKNAAAAEKERDALTGRLASPGFVDKAKPEAVDKARADLASRGAEAERLRAALARLG